MGLYARIVFTLTPRLISILAFLLVITRRKVLWLVTTLVKGIYQKTLKWFVRLSTDKYELPRLILCYYLLGTVISLILYPFIFLVPIEVTSPIFTPISLFFASLLRVVFQGGMIIDRVSQILGLPSPIIEVPWTGITLFSLLCAGGTFVLRILAHSRHFRDNLKYLFPPE